jgi:asparagine synthase (glutamine-hydrolysing)
MRLFVCVLDPTGRALPDAALRRYEAVPRSRGLTYMWQTIGQMAVLTTRDAFDDTSMVARAGDWVAVGNVRLDNRADLERWAGRDASARNALEIVLHTVVRHGNKSVPDILGDFCFVAWNASTRTGLAACDVFAHRKLYFRKQNGTVAFASQAELLAMGDQYEAQYLAELVANCLPSPELTPYVGVHALPAAAIAEFAPGRLAVSQYWSPAGFEPNEGWAKKSAAAVERCRDLLTESVRLRMSGGSDTWAQLSGGIDSSSVVSIAQVLLERGAITNALAGTVTFVDRQGSETDERRYSDLVAARWRLRNETIVDPPLWHDLEYEPPHTDLPNFFLPVYPRERRLCAVVRAAGGRVLLTGQGSDEIFTGIMFFFADLLARGRVRTAVREMARWAAIGRVSFWDLAYRNAVLPLLPRPLRRRMLDEEGLMPPWVSRTAASRYNLHAGGFVASIHAGRPGHKYHQAIVETVVALGRTKGYGVIGDALDVRHPFLYRPLVEFALQLPPSLCAQPYARKWILREAMRGILPEMVRTRVGKAMPTELCARSLATQRALLAPLVQDPILADLGIIDAERLRTAFDAAPHQPHRRNDPHGAVQSTLIIEAWLQMRSGRWPPGSQHASEVA